MSLRVPLPNRRQLQTLDGLIQAIKYHMNVASNTIITDDSALGYINLTEDIDLMPLKTFYMKKSEIVTVDRNGHFRLRNLKYPVTEMIGVFYEFQDRYAQNDYLDYVDPITFGTSFGAIYANGVYTVDTACDGTNDQILKIFPAARSCKVGVTYYSDWPKLGDLSTNSTRQVVGITVTGAAAASGVIEFTTTIGTETTDFSTVEVTGGDSAATVVSKILAKNLVPFRMKSGNNVSFWGAGATTDVNKFTLSSPEYISQTATVNIANIPAGLTFTLETQIAPFLQTVESNWFLYNYPYCYYYGALKHAYNGLEDLERYALVEKEWLKSVQVFQQFTDRAEWAGSGVSRDWNQNVVW